jgi:ariadne-1
MEVDGFGGGAIEPTANKRKIYDVDHESMAQSDIEALIRKDVEHICSIFGITVRTPLF